MEIQKYDKGNRGKPKDPKQRTLDQFLTWKPPKHHKASPELKGDHPEGDVVPWVDEAQLEKGVQIGRGEKTKANTHARKKAQASG